MATKQKDISGEKTAAASYILTFYQDVISLTHGFANYENVVLELQTKYETLEDKAMGPDEKQVLLTNCQNVRYFLHKTYIEYSTILKSLKKEVPKEVKELYEKIKQQLVVNRDDILDYTMKLNFALEEQVMQNLLKTSNDFIEAVYGEKQPDSEQPGQKP